jgi:hypothetical protein
MRLKSSRSLVCLVALIAGVGTACSSDKSDVSGGAGEPADASEKAPPHRDAYYDNAPTSAAVPKVATSADGSRAVVASVDERRGVPTFLRASKQSQLPNALAGSTPEAAARWHLGQYARLYKLSPEALDSVKVTQVHDTGRGGIITVLRQEIGGIKVFHNELKVLMKPDRELVAISGNLHASAVASAEHRLAFKVPAPEALANALQEHYGLAVEPSHLVDLKKAKGDYSYFDFASTQAFQASGRQLVEPARIKKVFFPLPDRLVPAYYLEILAGKMGQVTSDAYAYVIAADDGRVLYRQNLTEYDSFNYKVFADADGRPLDGPIVDFTPHPTGTPDSSYPAFAEPLSIAMEGFNHNPQNLADPWLAAAAVQTLGNNVDAYADLNAPDGLSNGDLRAVTTAAKTFDYTYDLSFEPAVSQEQSMAAVTDLFYVNNWLHDWWYDSGFNEAAGNAQQNNFGRGGLGGDVLRAEAQDFSGTNNANMSTPADGASPRMQMFLWSGTSSKSLNVVGGNTLASNTATFGPTNFDLTADAVLADDGVAPNTNGCEALINDSAVAGKIAVIDRGVCSFTTKVKNAQNAGAAGVLLVNNIAGGSAPSVGGVDATITIPVLSTTLEEGNSIKTALQNGPVSLHMAVTLGPQRDGTIDNSVVAHEFGHYLHHRLVHCGGTVCGGMSEGWGDFTALQMMVRPGDNLDGAYPLAVYATVSFTSAPGYFGIRRYPYSTDMTKNGLTFKHMSNGQALPPGPMGGGGAPNAEPHNSGEVWSSMLFEGFISLLKQSQGPSPRYTFAEARRRMSDYVVAGMMLTPVEPTYLEQRDAILAAAYAADPLDADLLAAGFAKRGAGSCAVSPPSDSTDNAGVVESFEIKPDFEVVDISLEDSVKSCDSDGLLDADETGRVTIEIMNTGEAPLVDAVATVSTTTAGVSFPSGTQVTFGSMNPSATATATLQVALDASFPQLSNLDLTVTLTSANTCTPTLASTRVEHVNVDTTPSPTDTVEVGPLVWTLSGSLADSIWGREASEANAGNHVWHGVDVETISDTSIESPDLNVSAVGNFVLTFTHRHQFEFSQDTLWDGSVIEISEDGGANWVDISTYGNPGYTGVLYNQSGNPLGGRQGYADKNPSWPGTDTVAINMGTALANKTVKIRFRIGTDGAANGFGWQIDDVALQGITNTPFFDLSPDAGQCLIVNGGACMASTDCGSSFCVDGVCCNTACGGGSAGDCQACSTAAGAAVNGTCSARSAGTVCRGAAGACDVAESCNGVSTVCPADVVSSSGTTCRAAEGACDAAESCNGVSAACPSDAVKSSGTTCRAAAGTCDVAESCNGMAKTCPADALKSGGTVCRAAVNTCDLTEVCTGASASCPANGVKPDLSVCQGPLGLPGVCLVGLCL